MPATLAHLVRVRSQAVIDALRYLDALERRLTDNPLLARFGRSLEDPDLRIPLRVAPYSQTEDIATLRAREHFRQTGWSENDPPPQTRRLYAMRDRQDEEVHARSLPPEPLDALAPTLHSAVILGDPGSGKTEWLKYLACRQLRTIREHLKAQTVPLTDVDLPIYLRLRDLASRIDDDGRLKETLKANHLSSASPLTNSERIAAAIMDHLIAEQEFKPSLAQWMWDLLLKKGAPQEQAPTAIESWTVLCLDAWDEVSGDRDRLKECLHPFANNTSARLFLTSRLVGYAPHPLPVNTDNRGLHRAVRLVPFEWTETETFVRAFFRGDTDSVRAQNMIAELRSKVAVAGMAQNPLLVTLLCLLFAPNPTGRSLTLPLRRVDVYDGVLKGLLGDWPIVDKRKKASPELMTAKLRLLEAMAQRFFPHEELTSAELYDFLWHPTQEYISTLLPEHPLRRLLSQHPEITMVEDLCRDGVLKPNGADSFMFLRLTVQEFLVANALARQANDPERGWKTIAAQVDGWAWLPTWQEVIVLLAGKLNNPVPLLTMLQDPEPTKTNPHGDDLFRHRLALAAQCLGEAYLPLRERKDTACADQITADAFNIWWGHERKNTVNAVRHLTAAFPALGQANFAMDGTPLLERLAGLLADINMDRQRSAAAVLEEMGSVAATPPILAQLTRLLDDEDVRVRRSAVAAVSGLGSAAASFLERLIRLLDDEDMQVQLNAVETVRRLGNAAAPFLERLACFLADENRLVRGQAVNVVKELGNAAATSPILMQLSRLLNDEDGDARWSAVEAVGRLGSAAATLPILAQLPRFLADENVELRRRAVDVVGGLGSAAATPPILAQLARSLADENTLERVSAIGAVGSLGSAAATPPILVQLTRLLADENILVRARAAATVGRLRSAATPFLERLACLLADENSFVQRSAIEAVGSLGSAAATPPILVQLTRLLTDESVEVRVTAAAAIGSLGSAAATPPILVQLTRLLTDESVEVQVTAAAAMGRLGSVAAPFLERLACLLADEDRFVRRSAAAAVAQLASQGMRIFQPSEGIFMSHQVEELSQLLTKYELPRAARQRRARSISRRL